MCVCDKTHQVARLRADAETRTESLDRLSREREELVERLDAAEKEMETTEGRAASGAAREREAEGRLGEEARRRRHVLIFTLGACFFSVRSRGCVGYVLKRGDRGENSRSGRWEVAVGVDR